MDLLTQRGRFFDNVIKILLLTPVLAYTAAEIFVCLLWSLGFRTLQELCSLLFRSFNNNCKHGIRQRQPPLREKNIWNYATKAVAFHQPNSETKKSIQQDTKLRTGTESRRDTEFAWPSEKTKFAERKNSKTKDEQTRASKDDRTRKPKPELFTAKWVTQNKAFQVGTDTANKKDGLLQRNSTIGCQSEFEGRHEKKAVFCRGRMLLLYSDDQNCVFGAGESEDGLRPKIFDWKLRKRRGVSKQDSEMPSGKSTEVEESAHLRLKAALCDSVKKDVIGCRETYKPLPDLSGVTKEKCYSSRLVFSGNSTDSPIVSTDTPVTASQVKKHFRVSETFDGKTSEAEERTSQTKHYCSLSTASSVAIEVIKTPADPMVEAQNIKFTAAKEKPSNWLRQPATKITTTTTR